jgi:hypothetical protein
MYNTLDAVELNSNRQDYAVFKNDKSMQTTVREPHAKQD